MRTTAMNTRDTLLRSALAAAAVVAPAAVY